LLTGGGTGGHVNPCLAIAEGIREREPDSRFLYVGVRDKAEAVIVRRAGYQLRFIMATGFPGLHPSLRLLKFFTYLLVGMLHNGTHPVCATLGGTRCVSAPIVFSALLPSGRHRADQFLCMSKTAFRIAQCRRRPLGG
jgi:UDP-N-acetylglucosamine--N-acetylmuramyl-(pentapeptide) pyrophosphoryl-undecaprenol N-acetylglucosamine transferase